MVAENLLDRCESVGHVDKPSRGFFVKDKRHLDYQQSFQPSSDAAGFTSQKTEPGTAPMPITFSKSRKEDNTSTSL
jgi:hypothetical protein